MNWLSEVFARLAELWPAVRIQKWEKGVRATYIPFRGVKIDVLEPGVHFCWWWFQEVKQQTVVEQVDNLPTQTMTCKDGTPATLSVNFAYEVTDPEAAVNNVYDLAGSIQGLALMHIASKVRGWTWEELVAHQKDLERSIRDTLTTKSKRWGVEITAVGLTDLVHAKPYRFFGDPPVAHI